jgi:hypothetical protein
MTDHIYIEGIGEYLDIRTKNPLDIQFNMFTVEIPKGNNESRFVSINPAIIKKISWDFLIGGTAVVRLIFSDADTLDINPILLTNRGFFNCLFGGSFWENYLTPRHKELLKEAKEAEQKALKAERDAEYLAFKEEAGL